jgi:DNA polymerase V
MLKENHTHKITSLFLSLVPAGFPSPADGYLHKRFYPNEYLIKHPLATIFAKANDDSMIRGIFQGDLFIVDISIKPHDKKVVVALYEGNMIIRRSLKIKGKTYS